jgi:uncharacterized protein (DUF1684 family)
MDTRSKEIGMTQLEDFRKRKDHFIAHDQQSPLTGEQQENFQGLKYYPEDPALRLEIEVEPFAEQQQVQMQTSTGDLRTYARYGRFSFEVDGETAELTLFGSPHGYFLPFVDANAGSETYGAGRYLDPEQLPNGKFLIDFNLAYNPYCAYNENYSCPLPPAENRLKVAIEAGEKNFK